MLLSDGEGWAEKQRGNKEEMGELVEKERKKKREREREREREERQINK